MNLLFNPSHISSTPALTSAVQIGNNNRNTEVIVRSIMKKSREKKQRIPNPQTLSSEANVRLVESDDISRFSPATPCLLGPLSLAINLLEICVH